MDDRDTFAAAALTGLLRSVPVDNVYYDDAVAKQAYASADAMLRERDNHSEKPNSSTNHDAAPAARAEDVLKEPIGNATGEPGGVPEGKIRTGDTSAKTDTTQMRNGALGEPVAWANFYPDEEFVDFDRDYVEQCSDEGEVVPLYRAPQTCPHVRGTVTQYCSLNFTLTDEEREAIKIAAESFADQFVQHGDSSDRDITATLRRLLERLRT